MESLENKNTNMGPAGMSWEDMSDGIESKILLIKKKKRTRFFLLLFLFGGFSISIALIGLFTSELATPEELVKNQLVEEEVNVPTQNNSIHKNKIQSKNKEEVEKIANQDKVTSVNLNGLDKAVSDNNKITSNATLLSAKLKIDKQIDARSSEDSFLKPNESSVNVSLLHLEQNDKSKLIDDSSVENPYSSKEMEDFIPQEVNSKSITFLEFSGIENLINRASVGRVKASKILSNRYVFPDLSAKKIKSIHVSGGIAMWNHAKVSEDFVYDQNYIQTRLSYFTQLDYDFAISDNFSIQIGLQYFLAKSLFDYQFTTTHKEIGPQHEQLVHNVITRQEYFAEEGEATIIKTTKIKHYNNVHRVHIPVLLSYHLSKKKFSYNIGIGLAAGVANFANGRGVQNDGSLISLNASTVRSYAFDALYVGKFGVSYSISKNVNAGLVFSYQRDLGMSSFGNSLPPMEAFLTGLNIQKRF